MATTKVNARDWTFELNTGTEAIPAWTEIGGITSMTIGRESEDVDTTDFASNGVAEHEKMERGRTIELEGFFLEDTGTGTRDAGQAAVETLADAVGSASLDQLRITSPGGKTYTQKVSAELGEIGGGKNDKSSWGVSFTRSGATTVA